MMRRKREPTKPVVPVPDGWHVGCSAYVPCGQLVHDGDCDFAIRVTEPHEHDPDGCPVIREAHERWNRGERPERRGTPPPKEVPR